MDSKVKQASFKPIRANGDVDLDSFKQPLLRYLAHYCLYSNVCRWMPVVLPAAELFELLLRCKSLGALCFVQFPFAVLLGIWSALFWSMPTAEYVVTIIEETSLVTVLRRDRAAKLAALVASGTPNRSHLRSTEERHYDIKVDECLLEDVTRECGSKYDEGLVTPIKLWSIKYTMTRCRQEDWKWAVRTESFPVYGQPVTDPESQVSFLHFYGTTAAYTKCHALGNSLVERIVSDDSLKAKLMESTWTTTWLHHGLLHGTLGPVTSTRTEGNKWMGLDSPTKDSLVAESRNMPPRGGADHARTARWSELELPMSDFIMRAQHVLRKVIRDSAIPLDLQEGTFLSCITHAIDHVLGARTLWGIKYTIDFNSESTMCRTDHCASASWSVMWMAPTLHAFYHNKIRFSTNLFYRQLYRGLKEFDTFEVEDEITPCYYISRSFHVWEET